ncbi:hypothetical protein [Cypionkella aquatica]|uniref:hypothetical protein n=1 Tax=Cypionkella aquatica TaxID=1756042 RepID=UPI0024E13B30|nr:hypothetical protein [Cypionkella aquatica]
MTMTEGDEKMLGVNIPLGLPGSGRQRYAAAMTLYQAGTLSEAALEAYRICSPLDHQDPAPLLAVVAQGRRP